MINTALTEVQEKQILKPLASVFMYLLFNNQRDFKHFQQTRIAIKLFIVLPQS